MDGVTFADWEASLGGEAAHQNRANSSDGVHFLLLIAYIAEGHDPSRLLQGLSKVAGCPISTTFKPNLALEVAGEVCGRL